MTPAISVMKIGGSVLTGHQAYRRAAAFVGARLCARPGERIVAVVSAELGVTDALLAAAREIVEEPEPGALDLLWSTGELRSAALLALSLQAIGVKAGAVNVHQTGLVQPPAPASPGTSRLKPLRLRALLSENDVAVVPGFLACGAGGTIVSLGRGGSDLTAVLLAAGLGASRCELLKDVPGYFTADPKRDPDARPLRWLPYSRALQMADGGCRLVQRRALEAAQDHSVPLFISAIGQEGGTVVDGEG
ncbi:MAG TPA: hypothetical protein VJ813_20375 [Vicinamibacterales bacterium]|nr:hypothetical protein [Vicinamibacterales bacterium]